MAYGGVPGEILPHNRVVYKPRGFGREVVPHPFNTPLIISPPPHANYPNSISMAHFDENANFHPTIPIAENFNIYSHFYPMPDAGAETIQPLNNFENWNLAEQCGLFFDPLAVAPVPNSYGKHHDHRLVDRCLPCCLQTGKSKKSHIRPRTKTTLSQRTLANTYRRFNLNHSTAYHSSAVSQDGTVASLLGWPRNHLLSSQPPATVRTSSISRI